VISVDVFAQEVSRVFAFLDSLLGMNGPTRSAGPAMPRVEYSLTSLTYSIRLDEFESSIVFRIQLIVGSDRLIADLEEVLYAARIAPRNRVPRSALNVKRLRNTLETLAEFVKQLHPLLASDEASAAALMTKANARRWGG
jgi:hypothetical protein